MAEQGHLLGVVVVVVVDVDGRRDPTDDEGDPAGDQVEPAWGGHGVTAHLERALGTARHGCRGDGLVWQGKSWPSLWTREAAPAPHGAGARGRGGSYRSMGLGAGWDASPSGCRGTFQVASL